MRQNDVHMKKAYFAGGCFWCLEGIFEAQKGVTEAVAGYCGGTKEDAVYEKVSTGTTAHREAVCVIYDPHEISYGTLLDFFWTQIDPTDSGGQFADRGLQYTTAVYYGTEEERQIAEQSKKELENKFSEPIATCIEPFVSFFPAEPPYQDYYKNQPFRYRMYKQ